MSNTINQDLQSTHHVTALLEKAKESTEKIIDELPDLFFVINEKGIIYKTNSISDRYIDSENESLTGKNISFLFTTTHRGTFFEELKKLKNQSESLKMIEFELPIEGSDQTERVIFWNIKPLQNVRIFSTELYCVIGRDISISVLLSQKNQQLQFQKNRIQAILNSAQQGFFTIKKGLLIEEDFSVRAGDFLGKDITGKPVHEALNLNQALIKNLLDLFFQGKDWNLLKNISTMDSTINNRIIQLQFLPIYEAKKVERILGIATDITQIKALEEKSERTSQESRTILKILQSKEIFLDIIRTVNDIHNQTYDELAAKRYVHTIKGEFAYFECRDFVEVCEEWESKWPQLYSKGFSFFQQDMKQAMDPFLAKYSAILGLGDEESDYLKVSVDRIKDLIHAAHQTPPREELFRTIERLIEVPLEECLKWLDGAWTIAATKLGKKVEPIRFKSSALIFPGNYSKLLNSLIHAVRNAADHGIESPVQRSESGKPEKGVLAMELELTDDFYHLRIKDDGRGAELDKIKEKATKKGIPIPAKDEDVYNLLFEPGFTTSDRVSSLSGRGIGLNVIKTEAQALGGDAEITSVPQKGMELHVWFRKKPLTQGL